MKNISRWAKANPNVSRSVIAVSHVLVVINSIIIGSLLFASSWGESKWSVVILANSFFILYVSYPKKERAVFSLRYSYRRQKIYDFSLVLLYSAVIACGVNNLFAQASLDTYSAPSTVFKLISYRSEPTKEIFPEQKLSTKKSIRANFKHKVKVLAKYLRDTTENSGSDLKKILLLLLSIGLTLLLGYLVAGLACNIACSGAEGLALVVLILGWGGIIWLEFIAIRSIGRLFSKKKTPKTN